MAGTLGVRPAHAASPARSGHLPHVPALDGLRGLAVVGVLLFHAGYLDGGFLGVDLFFVLSGFLITGLLLDDGDHPRLGHFYARRVRRLAPALLALVLAVGVLAPVLLDDGILADVRSHGIASLLYYANWHAIAGERDYFAALAGTNPFEHTWSLAIEEQVYLVWPLLMIVALRLGRGRRPNHQVVLGLAAGLGMLSLVALRLAYHPGGTTARAYYGTDTRAFAVLAGAVVAAWFRRPGARARLASSPAAPLAGVVAGGFLAVLWIAVSGSDEALYRGLLPAASIAGAVVVAVVAATGTRLLTAPPLVGLGLVSYGLYLWHWPVFVVLDADRLGFGGAGLATVRITVSIAIAVASYLVIERPVRYGMPTERWRAILPAAIVVSVAGLLIGTAGAEDHPSGDTGSASTAGVDAAPDGRPRLLVLGDSQAFELAYLAAGPGYDRFQVASSTFLGCGIGPGLPESDGVAFDQTLIGEACDSVLETWEQAAADFRPDVVLVHVGAWEVLDRRVNDRLIDFGSPDWDAMTAARIGEVMDALATGGRRVVWLAAPCFEPEGETGGPPERGDRTRVARWNELLRTEATEHGDTVLPYDDFTCAGPAGDDDLDGVAFRSDGVHVTADAAPLVWDWIAGQLAVSG